MDYSTTTAMAYAKHAKKPVFVYYEWVKNGDSKCGCFNGSVEEFKLKVKETHKKASIYAEEYLKLTEYVVPLMQNRFAHSK